MYFSITDSAMKTRIPSHTHNEAALAEHEIHKDLNTAHSYTVECNKLQVQHEAPNEMTGAMPTTAEDIAVALPPDTEIEQAEKPVGPPVEGNDRPQFISMEKDWSLIYNWI